MSFVQRLSRFFPLLAIPLILAGCQVTPYRRTLPEWVQRVYVPMAINNTFEPGLEELVTNSLAEEILSDGRLTLARKSQADVIARVTITDYREVATAFASDDVESRRELSLTAGVELFDPRDMNNPIARVRPFPILLSTRTDYRSFSSEIEGDARARLGRRAGRQLLRAIMTQMEFTQP